LKLGRRCQLVASESRESCGRVSTPQLFETVKAHVSRVLEKLELNNRVQIALLAHDAGEA
jgi:Bacterial regulatory proteins, luxR family